MKPLRLTIATLVTALLALSFAFQPQSDAREQRRVDYTGLRAEMVQVLKWHGIQDPRVLEIMSRIERHRFVPEHVAHLAYRDSPMAIGLGQTISQPYIVAYMTEVLRLKPEDKVLEIGTGSGYQAAVLAELVEKVYSIEIIGKLASRASKLLKELGYDHVQVRHGDGYKGWPEHAPFDAIIVTAAPPTVPQALIAQLKDPGGRMIVPVGKGYQNLILITKTEDGLKKESLLPVIFVPMVKGSE